MKNTISESGRATACREEAGKLINSARATPPPHTHTHTYAGFSSPPHHTRARARSRRISTRNRDRCHPGRDQVRPKPPRRDALKLFTLTIFKFQGELPLDRREGEEEGCTRPRYVPECAVTIPRNDMQATEGKGALPRPSRLPPAHAASGFRRTADFAMPEHTREL